MTRDELPAVFHDALDEALRRHEANRRAPVDHARTRTPDDAATAVSEALTARTISRPRARSPLVRLSLHRRDWPRVHEHVTRAHLRIGTVRNREGDDPRTLVIEVDAPTVDALRQAFPAAFEVVP